MRSRLRSMNLHELNRQPDSKANQNMSYWGCGWLRWPILGCMLWLGVLIVPYVPVRPSFFGWILYGMFWVPFSLHLSHMISNQIAGSQEGQALERRSPLTVAPRCPNCGTDVNSTQALCPSCYEDLLHNCDDCGKVINAPHKVCRECARKRKKSKLSMG